MRESDKRVFFNMKKEEPHTVRVGGKFSFKNLPQENQEVIKNKLAEKDDLMSRGLKGEIPGLLIDGKQVTKENIHDFEISKKVEKVPFEKKVIEKKKEKLYTKIDLEKLSFLELKEIGKKFGTTDRSKKNLIKEILKLQK